MIPLDQIDFPSNARPAHADRVHELVASIRLLGLQSPPTVIERNGRFMLVAGRHRLEALRVLERDPIPVRIVDFNDVEARLWTISENLHRLDLTALQRAEQIAEWVKLSEEMRQAAPPAVEAQPVPAQSPQAAPLGMRYEQRRDGLAVREPIATHQGVSRQGGAKPQGGRPESGNRAAARELGLTEQEVRRSQAIAALPAETKARAEDLGFGDNQSALLDAAKAPTPQAQLEVLERRADRAPAEPSARPLRNLENLAAGSFAAWIKSTTPNDRPHIIRMLRAAAGILEREMEAAARPSLSIVDPAAREFERGLTR